jgi:hypothetical protein
MQLKRRPATSPRLGARRSRARLKGEEVGDFSDTAKRYAMRLAYERHYQMLLGMEDQFETAAMRRGKELENDARLAHEEKINTLVENCSAVVL